MKNVGFWKTLALTAVFCFVLAACNGGGAAAPGAAVGAATGVGVRAQQVSPGGAHTVAIGVDGSLWAWGDNRWGQLGDGTIITHRSTPVRIGTDTNWASVSAGGSHTVGIRTDGSLWAWGWNNQGQLGDGTMGPVNYRNTPTRIGTDNNWTYVSAGSQHAVAVRTDGSLWVWGLNDQGQLGTGTTGGFLPVPVQVQAGTTWATVAAGGVHTVGIRTDGSLWAWGNNGQGRLGDGTTTLRNAPVRIGTANDWVSVDASATHSVGIREGGTLWAWGNNANGRLGDSTTTNRTAPVQIWAGTTWTSVSAAGHTVAIMENGTLWAWGLNANGQLGNNTSGTGDHPWPTRVRTVTDVHWASLSAGGGYSVAVGTDGTVWGWGLNWDHQLGDGTMTDRQTQIRIMP